MPAVFVHGVPETHAIWSPLVQAIGRDDVILLSPPGFGVPSPEGWTATRDDYVSWLVEELRAIDGPIDLVGHDWGGGHVVGAVLADPTLVRSWACDILGIFHADYEWHEGAQGWQTPDVGEEIIAFMTGGSHDDKVGIFDGLGLGSVDADALANGLNADMGRCILALYRSATVAKLGPVRAQLETLQATNGLAILADQDHYTGPDQLGLDVAEQTGAKVARLPGLGHWWMVEDPAAGAAALNAFWNSLPK